MKSKVWDQVEIGIFSLHRPLLTWKTLTRTRQIHTPQLPGADALFISSNAYIKMEMYKIFLVQRNEKTACWHINRNTCTIYYNLLQSPCNKHDLCEDDFAAACCTVAFGLSFFLLCSVFFFFEYLTGVLVIVSTSTLRGMPLVPPPVLHLLLERDPHNIKDINWIYTYIISNISSV